MPVRTRLKAHSYGGSQGGIYRFVPGIQLAVRFWRPPWEPKKIWAHTAAFVQRSTRSAGSEFSLARAFIAQGSTTGLRAATGLSAERYCKRGQVGRIGAERAEQRHRHKPGNDRKREGREDGSRMVIGLRSRHHGSDHLPHIGLPISGLP
jgi:hypothetical protein